MTVSQYPPSHLQEYSTFNIAMLEFPTDSCYPNEWCTKNSPHFTDSNLRPLGRESPALTTRPRVSSFHKRSFFVRNITVFKIEGRSHGRVVKGEDLQLRGRGFKSWCRILVVMKSKQGIINLIIQKNKGSQKHQKNILKNFLCNYLQFRASQPYFSFFIWYHIVTKS